MTDDVSVLAAIARLRYATPVLVHRMCSNLDSTKVDACIGRLVEQSVVEYIGNDGAYLALSRQNDCVIKTVQQEYDENPEAKGVARESRFEIALAEIPLLLEEYGEMTVGQIVGELKGLGLNHGKVQGALFKLRNDSGAVDSVFSRRQGAFVWKNVCTDNTGGHHRISQY